MQLHSESRRTPKMRRLPNALCLLALAAALGACSDSKRAREETPAAAPTPAAAANAPTETVAATPAPAASVATQTPAPTPPPAPPSASDVRAAIERVYKGAVAPDARPGSFVVGDFNGDGSEDLVARVRAEASRVADLNDDLSNWIVSDPRKVLRPDPRNFDPHQKVQKLPPPAERPRVGAADTLLVVLHGYKESGWRNPEASQTYLLKGAGGADLRAQARADARAATPPQTNPPRLMGDVIRETLQGEHGFLYWNGATYGWFNAEGDK
jgi:hypothetical protein